MFCNPIPTPFGVLATTTLLMTESATPFRSICDLAESSTFTLLISRFVRYPHPLHFATLIPYHDDTPVVPFNVNLLKDTSSAVTVIPYPGVAGVIITPGLLSQCKVSDLLITRFSLYDPFAITISSPGLAALIAA